MGRVDTLKLWETLQKMVEHHKKQSGGVLVEDDERVSMPCRHSSEC